MDPTFTRNLNTISTELEQISRELIELVDKDPTAISNNLEEISRKLLLVVDSQNELTHMRIQPEVHHISEGPLAGLRVWRPQGERASDDDDEFQDVQEYEGGSKKRRISKKRRSSKKRKSKKRKSTKRKSKKRN